jgi:hypothetical protein
VWELLEHLKSYTPSPWLCLGDFNEITSQEEKVGGAVRNERQMQLFRNVLETCNLHDLGYRGAKYTWTNCRYGGGFIKERIDRVVANTEWSAIYREVVVDVLAARSSDHKPILVNFGLGERFQPMKHRRFKFEAKWHLDDEYCSILNEAWGEEIAEESAMQIVKRKLENCKVPLSRWSGRKYGDPEKAIKEKTKWLQELQCHEDQKDWEEIKNLKAEIEFILEQEDTKWKQRAKQNWYQYGDRNTPFFHAWADHRKRTNHIRCIKDEMGNEWKKVEEISEAFISFYKKLFSLEGTHGMDWCLENLSPKVTQSMNEDLLKEFTAAEVDAALAQMHPLKSPGLDGFSACFYQRSWATVRSEVCKAVLDFTNSSCLDPSINATNIVLIPKIKNPTKISEYRPISLCNVIYKLIAKVLANRMKKVLPYIISHNQSAFVPGRLITDKCDCGV